MPQQSANYWASTENSRNNAWNVNSNDGNTNGNNKYNSQTVRAAVAYGGFKEAIKAVAMNFNAQEAVDLEAVLPEALKGELEPFIKGELAGALKGGISASFSKKVSGGFNIGPKDGSYFISFTDETFRSLISEYLRPATRKILFGE